MRLCILTSSYPRTPHDDTSIFLRLLAESLVNAGVTVTVLVPHDSTEPLFEVYNGVTIRRFKYGVFTSGRLAFGASLLSNIRKNPIRLFQVPGFVASMLWQALRIRKEFDVIYGAWALSAGVAALTSLFTKTPYVAGFLGSDILLLKSRVASTLLKFAFRSARSIIVVSEEFREIVGSALGGAHRISVISNGVSRKEVSSKERDDFAREKGLNPQGRYIVAVSSLRPMKRIEVAIELLSRPVLRDFELIICGRLDDTEYHRRLMQLTVDLNCTHRVHFMGQVPPTQIPNYLTLAQYFITASAHEGRPNAVMEAFAQGAVVLASNIEAHVEIISSGHNGVLFDPNSLDQLSRKIMEIEAMPPYKLQLIEGGKKAISGLTWSQCASEYIKIFFCSAAPTRVSELQPTKNVVIKTLSAKPNGES